MKFKNIIKGNILTEKEYMDLTLREAKELWEDEDTREQWDNDFEAFYQKTIEMDLDFEVVEE